MPLFITQLIYLQPGQEATFDAFEAVAIPIIGKHHGRLLLRVRPPANAFIEAGMELPDEIHLVEFATEPDFQAFMLDEERKAFLHLKEASIRSSV